MAMEAAQWNRFKRSVGDWICCDPDCANVNFARRIKCYRCHKERRVDDVTRRLGQEIGIHVANKSKGLFTADDWQCSKCGNVNWARRSHCNMCNAPKFRIIEERNGYGGGYNDREVVEYIKRDDSDSEYDEFGRKKRMKRCGKLDNQSHNENLSDENLTDEKLDVSDEDDNDLSNYDLSGWGDDEPSNDQSVRDFGSRQANAELKGDRSPSISRSRSPANRK